jgi:Zinc knuckle
MSKVKCYSCDELSHIARDCKKPRRKGSRSSPKGKQPAGKKGFFHTEISKEGESDYSEESESGSQDEDSDLEMQIVEALYEIQDGGEVIRRKDKQPLLIFEGMILMELPPRSSSTREQPRNSSEKISLPESTS